MEIQESGPNERPLSGRSPLESNFCRERPDERPLDHLANGQSFFDERPQHKLANGQWFFSERPQHK